MGEYSHCKINQAIYIFLTDLIYLFIYLLYACRGRGEGEKESQADSSLSLSPTWVLRSWPELKTSQTLNRLSYPGSPNSVSFKLLLKYLVHVVAHYSSHKILFSILWSFLRMIFRIILSMYLKTNKQKTSWGLMGILYHHRLI